MKKNIRISLYIFAISTLLFLWQGCSKDSLEPANNNTGTGGSFARFTIINNYLYAVNTTSLNIYDISNPAQPNLTNSISIGEDIETIYPFKDKLFIGSATGLHIYDISNPKQPIKSTTFEHATACDPVVANDSLAFVTLRSGNDCNSYVNPGLYIIDVKDINHTKLINYEQISSPYGVGYDSTALFVCAGSEGLYVYDYTNPLILKPILHLNELNAYDVIPYNGLLLVICSTELRQYDYTTLENIKLVSILNF